jgi:hypothetical protein
MVQGILIACSRMQHLYNGTAVECTWDVIEYLVILCDYDEAVDVLLRRFHIINIQ